MRDFTGVSGASGGDAKASPLPATQITAPVLNSWKDELANAIIDPTGGNVALDPNDSTQLLTAIKTMIDRQVEAGLHFDRIGSRIRQWGSVRGLVTTEATQAVVFPFAFPTAVTNIQLTGVVLSASIHQDLWPQTITSTITVNGFTVQYQSDDGSDTQLYGFDWEATGY